MQDDDLFAEHPPNNEHRLDQHRQVGEVLNKLLMGLKLHLPTMPLGTKLRKVPRRSFSMAIALT
jgi:hypothetical protein